MPFCTACGQRLDGEDRFCGRCGTAVKYPSVQQPSAPDPAAAGPASSGPPATEAGAPATVPRPAEPAGPGDTRPAEPAGPGDTRPGDTGSGDTGSGEEVSGDGTGPQPPGTEQVPTGPSGTGSGPLWEPGAGPIPLPARSPSVRRAILAVGLPIAMIAAGLVGLLTLFVLLRSDDGSANLAPRVVASPSPTASLPHATGPGPVAGAGSPGAAAPPTTSATPRITATTARQQAREIEALLDEAARAPVTATVESLSRCDADPTSTATIQTARNTRSRLLEELERVPVDRLRDGTTLRSALRETWVSWVEADRNYLIWAEGITPGSPCDPDDPVFENNTFKVGGDRAAATARRAGAQFVERWNENVARPLQLRPRRVRDL